MTKEEMSKDEILRKWVGLIPYLYLEKSIGQIHSAMDEYAKQQAIAFSEWAAKEGYYHVSNESLVWKRRNPKCADTWTTEDVYNQFIEQQIKE